MYKALAIWNGVLIALMVSFNGLLAESIGNNEALILIHLIGLMGTTIIFFVKREKFVSIKGLSPFLFTAGLIGIFNVTFNNICFIELGAALTLGLCLLGQLIASSIIDHFGLLGVKVNPLNLKKITGIIIMSIGIVIMIVI
ncbi:DMT family transporter [Vallitalea pronyensis]|uniref:DMT family transporter n=1 Tax=Vallitalea pronyensis TaxID=1348613 RepID=A0A8J8MM53_9FIRM|nr:DMT family transporter [Vallitalea pronyensis]QUI24004.1 DMT family transporter [Vallitalea pronyensis]